jgi:hypothetical protein
MVWSLMRIALSTIPKVMMTERGRLGLWVGNAVGKDIRMTPGCVKVGFDSGQ